MNATIDGIFEAVLKGDQVQVETRVRGAIAGGMDSEEVLKKGLIAAMAEVGNRFEKGEYYVPEMLIAAHAMKTGMALLRPLMIDAEIKPAGKVIIGTVKGDLHDIGKNLVAMMLEGAGYEIIDLGTDVAPDLFAQAVREENPDFLGLSALLTTTMTEMKNTIETLEKMGIRRGIKVIIGGAPITQEYAKEIGADGFAPDASRAVNLLGNLK